MLADKDTDETIGADWKAIQEKYAAEEPEPAAESETAATEGVVETPETRPRDETGKFTKTKETSDGKGQSVQTERAAKVPAEAAPKGAEQARTAAEDAGAVDPGSAQGARADLNRAPSSWKPAARAEYDKLPKDSLLRAEIHRRETDMAAGVQNLLPDAQLGKGMREVIAPYEMLIKAEGGTPERAVADLMRTAAIFRVGTPQQKLQVVAQLGQQFGIDLTVFGRQQAQPGQQPTQQQPQTFRDPRVDQILAQQQQQESARQTREKQEMESTVTRWMNEVGADGNPTRPYLSDVINEMAALIPQVKQVNPALTNAQALEEAYNRAIWAHPEIRTLLQQKAAADLDVQRRADNQTRVRDARRAASVNVPRRASLPATAKPGAMEDTIAATARELGLIT